MKYNATPLKQKTVLLDSNLIQVAIKLSPQPLSDAHLFSSPVVCIIRPDFSNLTLEMRNVGLQLSQRDDKLNHNVNGAVRFPRQAWAFLT